MPDRSIAISSLAELSGSRVSAHAGTSTGGHFFEDQSHREIVVQCIGDGILPLKFAYAGSAAHTHDRLARSEGYRSVIGSVFHEMEVLRTDGFPTEALSRVIEIGPGNGMHTVAFLQSLGASGHPCGAYLGLDFSATLLDLACTRIREAFGTSVSVSADIWDIEVGPSGSVEQWRSAWAGSDPLLVCLLGHTLGNLESGTHALAHIRDSLRPGDVLLAGLTLGYQGIDEETVLAPYRTDVFRDAALEPLRAAGVDPYDINFDVRFTDGAVIGEAVFLKSVQVGASTLPPGHVLRCFCSRRFAVEEVLSLFRQGGWTVRTTIVDDRREHAVVTAVRGDHEPCC